MTILATGRAAFFLMATFALFVEGVFGGGSFWFGAVTAGTFSGVHTLVMTGLAVSNFALMGGMVEGDFAHFVGEFDFGRAVVGGNNDGADSEERNSDEESDKTFHRDGPPEIWFRK